MPNRAPIHHSPGGEVMMAVIAVAVIVVVAAEGLFVAYGGWLALPFMLLGVLAAAGGVIYAVMRTIDNDTPVSLAPRAKPAPEPEPEPARQTARRPIRRAAVPGH